MKMAHISAEDGQWIVGATLDKKLVYRTGKYNWIKLGPSYIGLTLRTLDASRQNRTDLVTFAGYSHNSIHIHP